MCSYEPQQQYNVKLDVFLPRLAQPVGGHGRKLVRQPARLSSVADSILLMTRAWCTYFSVSMDLMFCNNMEGVLSYSKSHHGPGEDAKAKLAAFNAMYAWHVGDFDNRDAQ